MENMVGKPYETLETNTSQMPNLVGTSIGYAEPEQQPDFSIWDEVKNTGKDYLSFVKNPSAPFALAKAGLEEAATGLKLASADYNLEHGSIYDTPEQVQEKRQAALDEIPKTEALTKGVEETLGLKSYLGKMSTGVIQSIGAQLPMIPAMLAAPELAPLITGSMFFNTYGQKYQERINKGFSPEQADASATFQGAVEVGTEFIGLPFLTKVIKAAKMGLPISGKVLKEQLTEVSTEMLASLMQSGEDKAVEGFGGKKGFDAFKTWIGSEDFNQTMIDTSVATLMQGVAMGGALKPVQMQYKKRAIDQIAKLDTFIANTTERGAATDVPLADLQKQRDELVEVWEVKPEEIANASEVLQNKVVQENQAVVDNAAEGVKEALQEEVVADEPVEDAILDVTATPEEVPAETVAEVPQEGVPETLETTLAETPAIELPEVLSFRELQTSADRQDLIHNTPGIADNQADFVERLQKQLGFKTKSVMITAEELSNSEFGGWLKERIKERGYGGIDQIYGGAYFHGLTDPETGKRFNVITVNDKAMSGEADSLFTQVHEAIGHGTFYEHLYSAPAVMRDAIMNDFEKAYTKVVSQASMTADEKALFHKEFFEPGTRSMVDLATVTEQMENESPEMYKDRMFREWTAHQVSRAVLSSKPAKSLIERFWNRVAISVKKLYEIFKAENQDLTTGVSSIREFVDYLYKNANTSGNIAYGVGGKYQGLVRSIVDSMMETDLEGKLVFNPKWINSRLVDGKTVATMAKMLAIYRSKDGTIKREPVRPGHARDSLFGIEKVIKDGKIIAFAVSGPVETSIGKTEKGNLIVISTDKFPKVGALSPSNSAYQVAQNIRDMLIVSEAALFKAPKKAEFLEGFLQTSKGKAIKVQVPKASEKLQTIYQAAVLNSVESKDKAKTSSAQVFLEIMGGQWSAFSNKVSGFAGTEPISKRHAERTDAVLRKYVEQFQKVSPSIVSDLKDAIAQDLRAQQPSAAEVIQEEEAVKEVQEVSANVEEQAKTNPIEEKVDELIQNALPKKGKKIDGVKIFDEVGWRYMNELTGADKNYAEAYAKEQIEKIIGAEIAVKLKNNIKLDFEDVRFIVGSQDDLRVFHGTSRVIQDVPTMEKADPEGLYGPGIYTTEDRVDPETGHLIVTAGYARTKSSAHNLDGIFGVTGLYPEALEEAREIIAKYAADTPINRVLKGGELSKYYYTVKEDYDTGQELDSLQVAKMDGELESLAQKYSPKNPNILPLEIDPQADETFDMNKIYSSREISKFLGYRVFHSMSGDDLYEMLKEKGMHPAAINKLLMDNGFNFITHIGGGILGGVSHKVWIALKDGLVKSAFHPSVVVRLRSIDNNLRSDDLIVSAFNELYSDKLDAKRLKKKALPKDIKEGVYASILKAVPKGRKKKERKAPDPVKVQERRDKLNKFVTDMHTMDQEAKRQNLALSEYMVTTGKYTLEEIRKAIAKYHANVSLFSQAEIIMRLATHAGLVNENGREGLEFVIQALFPDREGDVLDEEGKQQFDLKGNPVRKMYKGSDGSIASLGTIAKDVLIGHLQHYIVNSTGESYDYTKEQSVRQRKTALEEDWKDSGFSTKFLATLKWAEQNWESRVGSTKSGKELIFRLKRLLWKTTLFQRNWMQELNDFGKDYESEEQREYLYDLLTGNATAKNEREEAFIQMIQDINLVYSKELELHQVKIYYKNGSSEFYRHEEEKALKYFPHMWERGSFEKSNQKMIQSLIDSGEAATEAQALKIMKRFEGKYIKNARVANIEMARETELGGWMTDPIKVYQKYISQTSRRLAEFSEFGASPELALAQFALKHFKEGTNPHGLDEARDLINQTLGVRVEEALMDEPGFMTTYGITTATGLMLQHAIFVQPGTATNMAMVGGFKNLVKSLVPGINLYLRRRNPKYREAWLEVVGALSFTMNKELYDIVLDDKARERGDKILRSFGVTQVDSMMRIVGALSGKLYAVELAMDYASKQTPKLYSKLKRLGLSPESIISREDKGILSPEELRIAALAFTEETNFVTNPFSTPVFLKNHPLGRIFMLFSRFVFQQHHLWKTVIKNDKFGGDTMRGILAGLTVGTPMMLLKMLLTGDDPEEVLKKDGLAKMIWKAFTTGAGPGLYLESIGNAIFQAFGKQTGAGTGAMAIDSPAFALVDTVGKGIKSASKIAFTDTGTDNDANKAYRGAMVLLQAAALTVPKVGVPLNAALGMTRPLVEKSFFPTDRQKETSYLQ